MSEDLFKKEDKVPEGMKKGPDLSHVPKEFIQAYNYAIFKSRQANPGKAFTLDGFHAMLDNWSKEQEAKIEEFVKKGKDAVKDGPAASSSLKEEKKAEVSNLRLTTVAEAKEALASAKDGDKFVWGTRVWRGQKQDFANALQTMADGDNLVWGT